MKKIFLLVFGLTALTASSFAQCDTKTLLTSAQTEYFGPDGKSDVRPEKVVIEMTKTHIKVTHETKELNGDITDLKCNWTEAFRNGKTSFKTTLYEDNGDNRNVSITIEAKDGKATVLVEFLGQEQRKLKLIADKFEEVK